MLKVRRSVLDRLHLAEALPPNSSVAGPENERSDEIKELQRRNRELSPVNHGSNYTGASPLISCAS